MDIDQTVRDSETKLKMDVQRILADSSCWPPEQVAIKMDESWNQWVSQHKGELKAMGLGAGLTITGGALSIWAMRSMEKGSNSAVAMPYFALAGACVELGLASMHCVEAWNFQSQVENSCSTWRKDMREAKVKIETFQRSFKQLLAFMNDLGAGNAGCDAIGTASVEISNLLSKVQFLAMDLKRIRMQIQPERARAEATQKGAATGLVSGGVGTTTSVVALCALELTPVGWGVTAVAAVVGGVSLVVNGVTITISQQTLDALNRMDKDVSRVSADLDVMARKLIAMNETLQKHRVEHDKKMAVARADQAQKDHEALHAALAAQASRAQHEREIAAQRNQIADAEARLAQLEARLRKS